MKILDVCSFILTREGEQNIKILTLLQLVLAGILNDIDI